MSAVRRAALLAAAFLTSVAFLAAGTPNPVLAGDAKVAETLMKSAKQSYQKGDFAAAATLFRKAFEETT